MKPEDVIDLSIWEPVESWHGAGGVLGDRDRREAWPEARARRGRPVYTPMAPELNGKVYLVSHLDRNYSSDGTTWLISKKIDHRFQEYQVAAEPWRSLQTGSKQDLVSQVQEWCRRNSIDSSILSFKEAENEREKDEMSDFIDKNIWTETGKFAAGGRPIYTPSIISELHNKIFLFCHDGEVANYPEWFLTEEIFKEDPKETGIGTPGTFYYTGAPADSVALSSEAKRSAANLNNFIDDEFTGRLYTGWLAIHDDWVHKGREEIRDYKPSGSKFGCAWTPVGELYGKILAIEHGGTSWYVGFADNYNHEQQTICGTFKGDQDRDRALLSLIDEIGQDIFIKMINSHSDLGKEEEEMTEEKDRKELAKKQLKKAGSALLEGAGMATIDAGGDMMLDFARDKFGDSPMIQALLSSNEGRELVKMFMAMTIQTIAYQTDMPKSEYAMLVAEKQLTLSGYKVLAPHLKDLMSLMANLGSLGENMSDPIAALAPSARSIFDEDLEKKVSRVK